jgi:thioredoxin:protein disulfide reductase
MLHILMLFISVAFAAPENPFRVTAEPLVLPASGDAKAQVTLHVPPGTYLYKEMTTITVANAGGLEAGEASMPPALVKNDPATGMDREVWDMDAVAEVPVKAPAKAGEHELLLEVYYQGCKGSLCYMPETELIAVPVTVKAEAASLLDLVIGSAEAAELDELNPVGVSTKLEGDVVVASFEQLDGWHMTQMMTSIDLQPAQDTSTPPVVQFCKQAWPGAVQRPDPSIPDTKRGEFDGNFEVRAEIAGPEGTHTLLGSVAYQACKADKCLLPQYHDFEYEVVLDGSRPHDEEACAWSIEEIEDTHHDEPAEAGLEDFSGGDEAGAPPAAFGGDAFADARAKGILPLLAMVFGAGFLVSLTPCVLPMVPITIGIIGGTAAGSRAKAMALSATYVLGLAVVYTALGLFAAVTGSIFGAWMQSIWVVGGVAAFFVAMGFSMFGFFEVGVPSGLATKLNDKGGAGYGGAFVVGAVGAIVAGPCSGPVIASLMVLIGQQGELLLGAFLMLAFSLGMGMIFLVAGAFSGAVMRPGAWMDTVKKAFGVLMWLGAIYFISAHIGPVWTALATGLVLVVTANFAWPGEYDEGVVKGGKKTYAILGNTVGIYLLVALMMQNGFIVPPLSMGGGGSAEAEGGHVIWGADHDAGLAMAAEQGKPVLIDFTADWCAACKELEHFTYTDPDVIARSEQYVTVMIDATDKKDAVANALLEKYEVKGLPTVLFLHPDGTVRPELTLTGYEPAEKFLPRMEAGLK